jgi:DNA-binding NarL/FixJ family response regulator
MARRLQPSSDPRLSEPGGTVNAALRAARRAAGLSLDVLAARTNFSKSYLGNVEAGRRRVTVEIAVAYDTVVGTGGLLRRMLADEPERLVGRTAEAARLRHLVVEATAGRGRVVWVEGEPGIGKSALLATGLAAAAAGGCRVLWAAADESLARFPLWVLLESVRGDTDPEWEQVTALLRGTGAPSSGDAVRAAAERFVLLVERRCAVAPVVLVVDDLQWADDMSLSVWSRLRRLVSQVPLLLVGSCRPVPRRPEMLALRRGVRPPDGVVLRLDPLDPGEVTELTARLAGAPAGPRLRAAVDQAGGNPLYLHEMVEALVREERVRVTGGVAELSGEPVARSLAAAIGARLDFLSDRARSVLRLAALLGPEPTVADLGVVAGRSAVELAGIVDEAVAAGVLVATAERMTFRHGLIRTALYEQTPRAVRVALHREAARALAAAGAAAEVVAEQLLAGGHDATGTAGWAVDWLAGGAAAALVSRAPQAALELIDGVPGRGGTTLAGYRISALSLLGRDEDVTRLGPAVIAEATDVQVIGQTAWTLAYSLGRLGRPDEARAVLDEVLRTRRLDRIWRARLTACDSILACDQAVAAKAVAEAEEVGDAFALGYALHGQTMAYHHSEPNEEAAITAMDRAIEVIGDRPETADLRGLLLANRVVALQNLSRVSDRRAAIGVALAAAERLGTVPRLMLARTIAADIYYDDGQWDDALAELAALADLVGTHRVLESSLRWHGIAALIAVHRDDRDALAVHLGAVMDLDNAPFHEMSARLRLARAYGIEAAGRPAEAAQAALVGCLRPGSTPLAPEPTHECQSELPQIIRLALSAGHRAEAEAFGRLAAARARTDVRVESSAVAQHCHGLLAADPDPVAAAVDGYERAGLMVCRAQALENLAVLRAGRGDPDGARRAYDAAADAYVSMEAAWPLRRTEARLRPFGLRRGRYRVRRRPATGWAALTPSERTVAELVAQGLSNPDIAARLHVSRRTVETHVAHLLTKLQARSRAEVTREVESSR